MIRPLRRLLRKLGRLSCYQLCTMIAIVYGSILLLAYLEYRDTLDDKKTTDLYQMSKPRRRELKELRRPTLIYWTEKSNNKPEEITCKTDWGSVKCDYYDGNVMLPPDSEGAYLFYASRINFLNLPLPRNPEKIIWAFTHEESPRNVVEFCYEKVLSLFNYSSTFSRHSDVPYPLHHIGSLKHVTDTQYFVDTATKNLFLNQLAPILYLQSDCHSANDRDKYVEELQNFQRVDSYGKCLNNKDLPQGLKNNEDEYLNSLNDELFLKFVARYKFVLAIENADCDDYITEKFWRAIHVGVVPIYHGSPTIRDWLPNNKSAIVIDDFPTPEALSAHIDELMQDDKKYEEYLEHKIKWKITNRRVIEELKARPYQTNFADRNMAYVCFVCKKLHKKDKEVHIVTKSHYNCCEPISILTRRLEETNVWVKAWDFAKMHSNILYDLIMTKYAPNLLI